MTIPVWLLIALPAAGAAVLLLSGRRSDRWGHLLGCAASLGAFAVGAVLFTQMLGRHGEERAVHEALFSLGSGGRTAGGLRFAARPAVDVLRAADHRGRLAHPHLLDRLHGSGSGATR